MWHVGSWELVLIEDIIGILLWPGYNCIFEHVGVELKHSGRIEFSLELGCEVIELDHAIIAIVGTLLELVYFDQ